ncbi:hypothetical protein [Amycolatopsis magusensis]|uniref:hypothetical protein n=1 Tax=Amycolatopsis magusensis TaxID=882444 RepID=UPI0037919E1C
MAAEPLLRIRQRPARPPLTLVLVLGLVGLAVLVLTPVLVRSAPPAPVLTVVRGKMGSKVDFFRDPAVQEILRRKQFDVSWTTPAPARSPRTTSTGTTSCSPPGSPPRT